MRSTFRDQRLRRGWTLRDLAEACEQQGIPRPSDSNLSVIERRLRRPRPALRAVLSDLLNLPIDYFDYFDETDEVAS